jgi:3-isopropylmalate dehydrogenase
MASAPQRPDPASTWLEHVLPGWGRVQTNGAPRVIGVLLGEGIGPEILSAALEVLAAVEEAGPCAFTVRIGGDIGLTAERATGKALTPEVESFCESVFAHGGAVLSGPGGGRFVYDLRKRFDLFCKLVPLRPIAGLEDVGPLRPSAVSGVDVLLVRENTSGLYQGSYGTRRSEGGLEAHHAFSYNEREVARILDVAGKLALARKKRLHVIGKKSGAPSITALWKHAGDSLGERLGLAVEHLEVDNASYQLVAGAKDFDVIVAPNMLGDILADGAAVLLGSRSLSFSGNFGDDRRAVYQTGHGAAFDLAGLDRANPLGQIRALAMMLRESYGLVAASRAIEGAIADVLRSGVRTADVLGSRRRPVGTAEMGKRVAELVRKELARPGRPGKTGPEHARRA